MTQMPKIADPWDPFRGAMYFFLSGILGCLAFLSWPPPTWDLAKLFLFIFNSTFATIYFLIGVVVIYCWQEEWRFDRKMGKLDKELQKHFMEIMKGK